MPVLYGVFLYMGVAPLGGMQVLIETYKDKVCLILNHAMHIVMSQCLKNSSTMIYICPSTTHIYYCTSISDIDVFCPVQPVFAMCMNKLLVLIFHLSAE